MALATSWTTRSTALERALLTGVSAVVPVATAAGVILALGLALGGHDPVAGSVSWFLVQAGTAGMALVAPVFGAFVADAIGDHSGLAPGFVLTYAVEQGDSVAAVAAAVGVDTAGATPGLLGALVAGVLAGTTARWIGNRSVPTTVEQAAPILLVPALATLALLPVVLLLAVPLALATAGAAASITARGVAPVLGAVLGAMMAFDLGGPVNKVAYVAAIGLLVEGVPEPMAAVMVAGMVPPLGAALATGIRPGAYPTDLVEEAPGAVARAAMFVTEGAIPFTDRPTDRMREGAIVGSATAGGVSMALGVGLYAPHGGVLVVPLASDPVAFLWCVALGAAVTAGVATAGQVLGRPTATEVNSK